MNHTLLISTLLCAAVSASEVKYTDIEANYAAGSANLPDSVAGLFGIGNDLEIDAFQAQARYEITDGFFACLNYDNARIDIKDVGLDLDYWAVTAGLGGDCSLSGCLDLYYSAGYRYSAWGVNTLDQSIGHVSLRAGLRWVPASWLEVNPSLDYFIGVTDDDYLDAIESLNLNLNLYLTCFEHVQPFLGGTLELHSSSDNLVGDLAVFKAGVRFAF